MSLSLIALLLFAPSFDYDRSKPLDVQIQSSEKRDGVEIQDITFAAPDGRPIAAYLVLPPKPTGPAVLFVHWYEPESANSNRTQFLQEAIALGKLGTVSLLPATMWSEPKWFPTRKRADDLVNSIRQLNELRRGLDLLLAQPGVEPGKLAFVGHDFGGMFGAVIAGVDGRPKVYALQAATNTFPDWYLFGPKMGDAERKAFVEELSPIDPIRHIGDAKGPVLLQYGKTDKFVPEERALRFFEAAKEPKRIIWYPAGHPLNDDAKRDRLQWLQGVLFPRK